MVLVNVNGNYINPEPMKNKLEGSMIKAYYLALWNRLIATGTVKPKTHIWITKCQRNTKGNTKELHDPISPTGQPQSKSWRTNNTNLQEPLQGNPCGSRRHFSNATLGYTLLPQTILTLIFYANQMQSYHLSTPIYTWQLRLQQNAIGLNGMRRTISWKQWEKRHMGR